MKWRYRTMADHFDPLSAIAVFLPLPMRDLHRSPGFNLASQLVEVNFIRVEDHLALAVLDISRARGDAHRHANLDITLQVDDRRMFSAAVNVVRSGRKRLATVFDRHRKVLRFVGGAVLSGQRQDANQDQKQHIHRSEPPS